MRKGVIQIFNVGAERMLGLHGHRCAEQDHARGHLGPAGNGGAGQGAEPRTGHAHSARLRGPGFQGLARNRGHLRAHLHPQGRHSLPRRGLGHRVAGRTAPDHWLPSDRHRQQRAHPNRGGAQEILDQRMRDLTRAEKARGPAAACAARGEHRNPRRRHRPRPEQCPRSHHDVDRAAEARFGSGHATRQAPRHRSTSAAAEEPSWCDRCFPSPEAWMASGSPSGWNT